MPVRRFEQNTTNEHSVLKDQLVREWTSPNEIASEPLILEDFDRSGALVHVYVVWSRWSGIDRVARSEIIMDAAEERYGMARATEILVAMGLEPEEGRKMGLKV